MIQPSYPPSTSVIHRSMADRLPYVVKPMALADIDRVLEIEHLSFSAPWSARAYRHEITQNEHSTMLVVRPARQHRFAPIAWLRSLSPGTRGPVLGYGGFWLLVDDAHIATIAVHPDWRGRGLGELLLLSLLEEAAAEGAARATLEVRVSNRIAQSLYRKYGFQTVSRSRQYYADNDEDAYIMATPPFHTPGFGDNLRQRRAELYSRLREESPSAEPHLQGIQNESH
jgi:[ribosomal protein S18]-alanine N-acetyltransferase